LASTHARRYAQGLLNILDSADAIERVGKDLALASEILSAVPGLGRILSNPGVEQAKRKRILDEMTGKISAHPAVGAVIMLLAEQRSLSVLPEVVTTYARLKDSRLGVTSVSVVSAHEVPAGERSAWETALAKLVGTPVRIDYETDPSLIGGAVAKVGSVLYDGSVRGSLQKIRQSLLGE